MSAYPHHKVKSTHDHEKAALLTMGFHHKKCMTTHKQPQTNKHTHTHTHTHIHHAQCKHTKQGNKPDIANVPRVCPARYEKCKSENAILKEHGQARYKKDKSYMPTSKGYGQTRYWKDKIDFAIR